MRSALIAASVIIRIPVPKTFHTVGILIGDSDYFIDRNRGHLSEIWTGGKCRMVSVFLIHKKGGDSMLLGDYGLN